MIVPDTVPVMVTVPVDPVLLGTGVNPPTEPLSPHAESPTAVMNSRPRSRPVTGKNEAAELFIVVMPSPGKQRAGHSTEK